MSTPNLPKEVSLSEEEVKKGWKGWLKWLIGIAILATAAITFMFSLKYERPVDPRDRKVVYREGNKSVTAIGFDETASAKNGKPTHTATQYDLDPLAGLDKSLKASSDKRSYFSLNADPLTKTLGTVCLEFVVRRKLPDGTSTTVMSQKEYVVLRNAESLADVEEALKTFHTMESRLNLGESAIIYSQYVCPENQISRQVIVKGDNIAPQKMELVNVLELAPRDDLSDAGTRKKIAIETIKNLVPLPSGKVMTFEEADEIARATVGNR